MDLQLRPRRLRITPSATLNREAYKELVTKRYGSWDENFQRAHLRRSSSRLSSESSCSTTSRWCRRVNGARRSHLSGRTPHPSEFQNRGIGSRVLVGELHRATGLENRSSPHAPHESGRSTLQRHGFFGNQSQRDLCQHGETWLTRYWNGCGPSRTRVSQGTRLR